MSTSTYVKPMSMSASMRLYVPLSYHSLSLTILPLPCLSLTYMYTSASMSTYVMPMRCSIFFLFPNDENRTEEP